ncbi:MAG: hypothetical protein J7D61_07860 [Marichromatium sp.]|nr:hypothetical protein [Marichromatium sp.]
MRYLAFDLETNGLLPTLERVHMAILTDLETLETYGYTDNPDALRNLEFSHPGTPGPSGSIQDALDIMAEADLLVSFNGWGFDMLALEALYPSWTYKGIHVDLKTHGATIRPYDKLLSYDKQLALRGRLPRRMVGTESLKAWAIRAGLDEQKDDYDGGWEHLDPDMWKYGLQDGRTTAALYHWMMQPKFRVSWQVMWIEQEVGRLIGRQQANGWQIDVPYLRELDAQLSRELIEAEQAMVAAFGSWYRVKKSGTDGLLFQNPRGLMRWWRHDDVPERLLESPRYTKWPVKIPKRTMRRAGVEYTEGAPFTPVEHHTFNPAARADVYRGLHRKYGWEPKLRTDSGGPQVSSESLEGLSWPEAKAAHRYFLLQKIAGYTTSWLKNERGGRLHGRVNPNRANTRRMTHQNPNLANVPATGALYGEECRRVFTADDGWLQIGADAEQLELRCLANRLARYDDGAYANELMHGDAHTLHIAVAAAVARELVTSSIRKGGKSVTYAWLYGAGDAKLAATYREIKGVPKRSGKQIRQGYEQGITGVAQLLESLRRQLKARGWIRALDGGRLYSRSEHSVLNLQLQSDGALIMKAALIFAEELLTEQGLVEGRDWKLVGSIHDEYQTTAPPEHAEAVGQALVDGIRRAGEWFGFPLPTDGQCMIGQNWAETH